MSAAPVGTAGAIKVSASFQTLVAISTCLCLSVIATRSGRAFVRPVSIRSPDSLISHCLRPFLQLKAWISARTGVRGGDRTLFRHHSAGFLLACNALLFFKGDKGGFFCRLPPELRLNSQQARIARLERVVSQLWDLVGERLLSPLRVRKFHQIVQPILLIGPGAFAIDPHARLLVRRRGRGQPPAAPTL